MSWFKLDNGMPEHPKIVALEARTAWAFVCSLAYASRNLTDGFVPDRGAWNIASQADVWEPAEVIEKLVDAGLWEPVEDGYKIHDYLDYQRSRSNVLELSKTRADAGRKGGEASGRARSKQTRSKPRSKNEADTDTEKERTARTREGKSKPEPRPAQAAYQPHQHDELEPLPLDQALELARRAGGQQPE